MNAKLTTTHDWVRVTATTPDKARKINLTIGRSGESVSGKGLDLPIMKAALVAFGRFCDKGDGTVGQKMERVQAIGQTAQSMEDFVDGLAKLS